MILLWNGRTDHFFSPSSRSLVVGKTEQKYHKSLHPFFYVELFVFFCFTADVSKETMHMTV